MKKYKYYILININTIFQSIKIEIVNKKKLYIFPCKKKFSNKKYRFLYIICFSLDKSNKIYIYHHNTFKNSFFYRKFNNKIFFMKKSF